MKIDLNHTQNGITVRFPATVNPVLLLSGDGDRGAGCAGCDEVATDAGGARLLAEPSAFRCSPKMLRLGFLWQRMRCMLQQKHMTLMWNITDTRYLLVEHMMTSILTCLYFSDQHRNLAACTSVTRAQTFLCFCRNYTAHEPACTSVTTSCDAWLQNCGAAVCPLLLWTLAVTNDKFRSECFHCALKNGER